MTLTIDAGRERTKVSDGAVFKRALLQARQYQHRTVFPLVFPQIAFAHYNGFHFAAILYLERRIEFNPPRHITNRVDRAKIKFRGVETRETSKTGAR